MQKPQTIAVLGGTGQKGGGLALRWAKAGHRVILGSRDAAKAAASAEEMKAALPGASVRGALNKDAAAAADVVALTVPFSAQRSTVEDVSAQLEGKILVDATAPLVPPKVARVQLPADRPAVAAIQKMLGAGRQCCPDHPSGRRTPSGRLARPIIDFALNIAEPADA